MKKLKYIFGITFALFISCIQVNFGENQENYGTIVFDLTSRSNLRGVNADGLPDLSATRMKIIVETDGRRADIKEFDELDEKQYKRSFLVGSKIKFIVIVMTKGGKWKGNIEHTVMSGTNSLSVKLKKATSTLEPLKFKLSTNLTDSKFNLGFLQEDSFFEAKVARTYASIDSIPSFCRDQKGRTYVLYNDGTSLGNIQFKRYTSEGFLDDSFMSPTFGSQDIIFSVTSDYKTGKVFFSCKEGSALHDSIFLLKEENPTVREDISPLEYSERVEAIQVFSVYNDIFAIVYGSNSYKLGLYKPSENGNISRKYEVDIDDLLKISVKNSSSPNQKARIVDCYMNDKDIYILYNCYNKSSPYISTGGILKVSYSEKGGSLKLETPKRVIGKDAYLGENNIINVQDGSKELYGPRRFVGFDGGVLYIADDGVVREYEAGVAQTKENKNRLVRFSLKDCKLSVANEESDLETWVPEKKAITKTNETLFFSYEEEGGNTVAKIKLHDGTSFAKFGNKDVLSIEKPDSTLVYSFDSTGNFYVRSKSTTNEDFLKKYCPHKTENGIKYEEDVDFKGEFLPDVNSSNSIESLYYDGVQKHLYYKVNGQLYKLDGNIWNKVDKGAYIFQRYMAIYDGKIISYNNGIKRIDIKDGKIEGTETPIANPLELSGNSVVGISVYNDIFYFLYKDSTEKLYALALNSKGVMKKTDVLFTLSSYLQDLTEIRPIGFDENTGEVKLFLDGIKKDYDGRIEANLNCYVSLKYGDSHLFQAEKKIPSNDIKWYEEEKTWEGAIQGITLWKGDKNQKAKYEAVSKDYVAKEISNSPSLMSSTSGSAYNVYNKFCYDQFGNLYVLIEKGGSYYVVRFELTDDKDYSFSAMGTILNNATSFNNSKAKFKVSPIGGAFKPKDFIMAVYADTPNSGILYYRGFTNDGKIKIYKKDISDGGFNSSSESIFLGGIGKEILSLYTDSGKNIEKQFVAMATNKDGLFIAQKEAEYESTANNRYYKNYNIQIRKYLNNNNNYASPDAKIDVVGTPSQRKLTNMFKDNAISYNNSEAQWDDYIRESISDMYAYNGVLYALSYKQVGGEAFATESATSDGRLLKTMSVSGKLLKVGKNTNEFTGEVTILKESNALSTESGKFAPSHIIGIFHNQLVIASDGYYGSTDSSNQRRATNYNKIYFFKLKDGTLATDNEEIDGKAYFNIEYKKEAESDLTKEWALVE